MILKMELKIHLTSQLQLSGPEAAFKDRSCGCDMKAKRPRCFVSPPAGETAYFMRFFQRASVGLLWSYSSLYKRYSLLSGLLSILAYGRKRVSKLTN